VTLLGIRRRAIVGSAVWALALVGLIAGGAGLVHSTLLSRFRCCGPLPRTRHFIKNLETAVETYMMDNDGECPASLGHLYTLKIINRPPRDGWGRRFRFVCPGVHDKDIADISSAGPDGRRGTSDDITSWSPP
jgi:hypothetical protein